MGVAGLGIAGAILAVVATFSTVIEIRTRTVAVTLDTLSGWDRHGPALLVLGVFALVMVAGAVRGARPAMAALAAAGIAVLLIAILADQPHLHDTGRFGEAFDAEAQAGKGWLLETASGVLMLASGALLLLLAPARRAAPAAPRPRRPRADEDWFAEPPA